MDIPFYVNGKKKMDVPFYVNGKKKMDIPFYINAKKFGMLFSSLVLCFRKNCKCFVGPC